MTERRPVSRNLKLLEIFAEISRKSTDARDSLLIAYHKDDAQIWLERAQQSLLDLHDTIHRVMPTIENLSKSPAGRSADLRPVDVRAAFIPAEALPKGGER